MADNTALNAGSGGDTVRDVAKTVNSPAKTQVMIVDLGGVGAGAAETPWLGYVSIAPQVMTSVGSNLVAKSSAGVLFGFVGTTGSTPGSFYIFNLTAMPSDGTISSGLAYPPVQAAANTTVSIGFGQYPLSLSTGITIAFSSTSGLTFTHSATVLIGAQII